MAEGSLPSLLPWACWTSRPGLSYSIAGLSARLSQRACGDPATVKSFACPSDGPQEATQHPQLALPSASSLPGCDLHHPSAYTPPSPPPPCFLPVLLSLGCHGPYNSTQSMSHRVPQACPLSGPHSWPRHFVLGGPSWSWCYLLIEPP